jgi:hypothetical protein
MNHGFIIFFAKTKNSVLAHAKTTTSYDTVENALTHIIAFRNMPPTLKQTVQAYRIYLSSLKLQAVNCSIPGACLVLHSETRFLATAGQGGAAEQGSGGGPCGSS